MNKFVLYSVFAVLTLFLTSCSDNDKVKVQETCERFVAAVLANDLATAKSMVTPETYAKWGNPGYFDDIVLTPEIKANLKEAKSIVKDVNVEGDKATATLVVGIPAELVGEVTTLHLQKHGNVWFIHEPGILVKDVLKDEIMILDVEEK